LKSPEASFSRILDSRFADLDEKFFIHAKLVFPKPPHFRSAKQNLGFPEWLVHFVAHAT